MISLDARHHPHGRQTDDYGVRLPDSCGYMKVCFASFAELELEQDTSCIGHGVEGEPL